MRVANAYLRRAGPRLAAFASAGISQIGIAADFFLFY